jgi:hypothetical protein
VKVSALDGERNAIQGANVAVCLADGRQRELKETIRFHQAARVDGVVTLH